MTLVVELPAGLESRLKSEAERRGLPAPEFARQLIEAGLPGSAEEQKKQNQATLDLLAKWDHDLAMATPEEVAEREQKWQEFQAAMNRNRVESDGPDARVPFP